MSRRMPAEENGGHDGLWRLIIPRSYMINGSRPSQSINLGLPLHPHRRPARRHHLRDCRHGLVDHADAGIDLSIRAEGSRPDHGGGGRDGEPVAHSRLVARGRLASLPCLFDHRGFRPLRSARGRCWRCRSHAVDIAIGLFLIAMVPVRHWLTRHQLKAQPLAPGGRRRHHRLSHRHRGVDRSAQRAAVSVLRIDQGRLPRHRSRKFARALSEQVGHVRTLRRADAGYRAERADCGLLPHVRRLHRQTFRAAS